jgi:hypothetical protein
LKSFLTSCLKTNSTRISFDISTLHRARLLLNKAKSLKVHRFAISRSTPRLTMIHRTSLLLFIVLCCWLTVVVHPYHHPECGESPTQKYKAIKNALGIFQNAEKRTLICPEFSYSFCHLLHEIQYQSPMK